MRESAKLILAVWTAKLLTLIGRLAGKKSTSMPGVAALKICPNLIRLLSPSIAKDIIVVCGTNGKTTTNNLLMKTLTGSTVICNSAGANMLSGIAALLAQSCNVFGKFTADYACLEVDEAFAVKLFEHLTPSYMVVTNLFRDQLDRYGEIDTTSELIEKAIQKAGNVKLILNGDDPLTARFGVGRKNVFYFGIDEKVLPQNAEIKEGRFCVLCGEEMSYNYFHYGQLGDFYCQFCGWQRPVLNFAARNVRIQNRLEFSVNGNKICMNYKGFYNIYNVLAVYAVISVLDIGLCDFNSILSDYKPQTGRMEEFTFNKPVILNLSKNPSGFNQTIMAVQNDTRKKDIIVVINDNPADGLDVSWLWDVDFDKLGDSKLNTLAVSGARLYDVALRFKYASIKVDYIEPDIRQLVEKSLNTTSDVCYILVNYTALFSLHSILSSFEKSGKYGVGHG